MEFLFEYGLFLAKAITWVVALGLIVGVVMSASLKNTSDYKGQITVSPLNERFDAMREVLQNAVLSEKELKALEKEHKKEAKQKEKADKKNITDIERRKRVYVLDFDGDIKASAVEELRETITAVLTLAEPQDEVVAFAAPASHAKKHLTLKTPIKGANTTKKTLKPQNSLGS